MARLIKVASWPGTPRGHVIFVHGLGGHPYDTWRRGEDNDDFWPVWLARDIPGLSVWTLSYAAPPTNWIGNALPLQDRAVTVLERLLSETELNTAPVTFVCHSLGGLVVGPVPTKLCKSARFLCRFAILLFFTEPIVHAAVKMTCNSANAGSFIEHDAYSSQS